jgi:hypothetical protein
VKVKSIQIGSLCRSLTGDMTDLPSIRKIGTKIKEMRISYLKIQNVQVTLHIYTYMSRCIYVLIFLFTCILINIVVDKCIHKDRYVYVYTDVYLYVCMYPCMYIDIHTYRSVYM